MNTKIWLIRVLIAITRRGAGFRKLASELNVTEEYVESQAARLKTISPATVRAHILEDRRKQQEQQEERLRNEQLRKEKEARDRIERERAAAMARAAAEKAAETVRQRKLARFRSSLTLSEQQTWDEAFASLSKQDQQAVENMILAKVDLIDETPWPLNERASGARLSTRR